MNDLLLKKVEKKILSFIEEIEDSQVSEYLNNLPAGKRLRAKLILKITPDAIDLAAIIEMIHAASLLHDDVIDEAFVRRGKPSINALFGNKNSIMLGDILYSKAFYELVSLPSEIARVVSKSVMLLSVGELMDVELAKKFNTSEELYFDMIYKKTASLIEASAVASAIYSKKKDVKNYSVFGRNLGLAFQIIDDILDVSGKEEVLGKPVMNDFKEGKTTLPYIYLYEALENEDREKLLSLRKKELTKNEKEWIFENMKKTNAVARAKQKAINLGQEAIEAVKDEKELVEIMEKLIYREY